MNLKQFHDYLAAIKGRPVLVVGDTIEDRNVYCEVRGISAETPTMVLEERAVDITLGGSACVARNLEALGAYPHGRYEHPRAIKTRYWVGEYKILQSDNLLCENYSSKVLCDYFAAIYDPKVTVIVADYRHGLIDEKSAKFIVDKTANGKLFVSSQVSQEPSNHHWYSGDHTIFVGNEKEHSAPFFGFIKIGTVTTLGERGCARHSKNAFEMRSGLTVNAVDTCGAGDAFLAAYALTESLDFANFWAGMSVTVKGANPPTIEMCEQWIKDHE